MPEDLGERTEQPTGRRLSQARSEGNVARSQEAVAAVELLGATLLVVLGGGLLAGTLTGVLREALSPDGDGWLSPGGVLALTRWAAVHAGLPTLGFALVMFGVGLLSNTLQTGWLTTLHPFTTGLSKLNPVSGLKRIASVRTLVRTLLSVLKLTLVATVACLVAWQEAGVMVMLPVLELGPALDAAAGVVGRVMTWVLVVLALLAAADLAYQRWQHRKDLRMTKQEVKDEYESVEGDPEMKGRRRRMAQELTMQRIRQAVPRADVVVTNPTHYAVAIRYDAATMAAPRVVAKGADYLALRIREVAAAHGVPVVERPVLARALYHGVPVGRTIDPASYEAVAEVLAYVYRLEGRAA